MQEIIIIILNTSTFKRNNGIIFFFEHFSEVLYISHKSCIVSTHHNIQ